MRNKPRISDTGTNQPPIICIMAVHRMKNRELMIALSLRGWVTKKFRWQFDRTGVSFLHCIIRTSTCS